jgi:tRNA 2-thiouridine synthesizing protein A
MDQEHPFTLDLRGLKCPLPALRTRQRVSTLKAGEELIVITTDPMARIDIPDVLSVFEVDITDIKEEAGACHFYIRAKSA